MSSTHTCSCSSVHPDIKKKQKTFEFDIFGTLVFFNFCQVYVVHVCCLMNFRRPFINNPVKQLQMKNSLLVNSGISTHVLH